MSENSRFTINELSFIKKKMEEEKYARDGFVDLRRSIIEKIERIIKRKVEGK